MKMNKLQRTGNGVHHLTIPEAYRKELEWDKGDYISITKESDSLILRLEVKGTPP